MNISIAKPAPKAATVQRRPGLIVPATPAPEMRLQLSAHHKAIVGSFVKFAMRSAA